MKICHYISSTGLGRGEFYIDLVNEMAKNKDLSLFLIIPLNAKYINRISSNIKVIEYKSKDTRYNPFLYLELIKIFTKNKFDIVHTHFAKASEIFYKLNIFLKLTHIATKHNPRKGKIFNKLKFVTAVSDDVAKSIKHNNVDIIYNGVNPIKIEKIERNDIFMIRAIGRLDKIKGFDKLIEEFSKVKSTCLLEIVGDGEEKDNLQKLIDKYNLNKRIKLVGFQTNIPELISTSDLIIMTSISEGFSLVMLESLFYSKVFISTPVSGCKDILSDILLIDNYEISNKIDDVIKDYKLYLNEFNNIKDIYQEKFLLSNIVNKYVKYYNLKKGKK
jgi:glycosyltransferase involved in cell wall biosynthesis